MRVKAIASALVWVYAVLASVAAVTSGFTVEQFSMEGLQWAMAFALASHNAGLNMIPNVGWQQAVESWAFSKIGA